MKEIIIYDSLSGNTEELAKEIKKEKPSAKLEKITTETVSQNDEIYYIGTPIIKGMCTDKIKKILMSLENKKIFLFVTAGYGGSKEYYERLKERIFMHYFLSQLLLRRRRDLHRIQRIICIQYWEEI